MLNKGTGTTTVACLNKWENSWVCTWDRLHSHSEEAFNLTFLTHYGHTMYQRHWVQQITQVHKSPEEKEKIKLAHGVQ